ARARRGSRAPLHQPPEQLHRLAAGRRRRPAEGPLPRHRRALPSPARRELPPGLRGDPRLPPPGRSTHLSSATHGWRRPGGPRYNGEERRHIRGVCRRARRGPRHRDLPGGDELGRELAETGGGPRGRIDPIRLSRSIVDAVSHFRARDPERVERLWQRIEGYRALLAEYHVKDEAVRARLEPQRRARRIRL